MQSENYLQGGEDGGRASRWLRKPGKLGGGVFKKDGDLGQRHGDSKAGHWGSEEKTLKVSKGYGERSEGPLKLAAGKWSLKQWQGIRRY